MRVLVRMCGHVIADTITSFLEQEIYYNEECR